jgi:hypothetical protein
MTDLLSKELIADMTFRVKYINEAWKEVSVDDYWHRYRIFAFNNVIWGCRNQNSRTNRYEELFRNTLKALSEAYKKGLLSKDETIDYEEFVSKYSYIVQMLS